MNLKIAKKVERVGDFATFVLDNGIGIAVNFCKDTLNKRFCFKTTNMRVGSLPNDIDFLNDEKLVEAVMEYFYKYMNFKNGQRVDTRIDKFEWFISSRLPLWTDNVSSELIRSVLFEALNTIEFQKDHYGSLMFTIEDIDICIFNVLSHTSLNKKRLIS